MRYHELINESSVNEATLPAIPSFLYHATSSVRLEQIMKEGLVPQHCADSQFYGEPARQALYLAREHCDDNFDYILDRLGGEPVMFQIRTSDLDLSALQPDDYDLRFFLPDGDHPDPRLSAFDRWQDVPWQLSLAVSGSVAYTRSISPSCFQRILNWV